MQGHESMINVHTAAALRKIFGIKLIECCVKIVDLRKRVRAKESFGIK